MNDAISVVLYIFNKIINFLFNQAYILDGVSIGWIVVTVSIFAILFNSILNTPIGLFRSISKQEKEKNRAEHTDIYIFPQYNDSRKR